MTSFQQSSTSGSTSQNPSLQNISNCGIWLIIIYPIIYYSQCKVKVTARDRRGRVRHWSKSAGRGRGGVHTAYISWLKSYTTGEENLDSHCIKRSSVKYTQLHNHDHNCSVLSFRSIMGFLNGKHSRVWPLFCPPLARCFDHCCGVGLQGCLTGQRRCGDPPPFLRGRASAQRVPDTRLQPSVFLYQARPGSVLKIIG